MGYAAYHATTSTELLVYTDPDRAKTLYTSQLVLNWLWMPLFFSLRRPDLALVDVLLLGANVAGLMRDWWTTDRAAFWMIVPYAGWLGFATYLNAGVGYLNNWRI